MEVGAQNSCVRIALTIPLGFSEAQPPPLHRVTDPESCPSPRGLGSSPRLLEEQTEGREGEGESIGWVKSAARPTQGAVGQLTVSGQSVGGVPVSPTPRAGCGGMGVAFWFCSRSANAVWKVTTSCSVSDVQLANLGSS